MPDPTWIDSPTLLTTSQFEAMASERAVPLFDINRTPVFFSSFESGHDAALNTIAYGAAPLKSRGEISRSEALASKHFHTAMEVEVDDLLANGAKFGYPP